MAADNPGQTQLEIAHVLFIDIAGYSKLLINEQSEQMQKLREIVRGTYQFRRCSRQSDKLVIPCPTPR
jgi:hypothetical protein